MRKKNNGLPFNVVIPNKTTEKVFKDKRNSGSKFHGSRFKVNDFVKSSTSSCRT
jgi:antitoxin component of RelBE/YafQ-DinJ toxin-antitoxin module